MNETWEYNCSTGNSLLRIESNARIVRTGSDIYHAEYWGDYSLRFPISGPVRTSLTAARRDVTKLRARA